MKGGMKVSNYSAENIKHLDTRNAMRQRIQMYLGSDDTDGIYQAFKEIINNSTDEALAGYGDKILLVGISYDADGSDKKQHTCVIEELQKFGTHEKNFRC